jgi:hypothetical protein
MMRLSIRGTNEELLVVNRRMLGGLVCDASGVSALQHAHNSDRRLHRTEQVHRKATLEQLGYFDSAVVC